MTTTITIDALSSGDSVISSTTVFPGSQGAVTKKFTPGAIVEVGKYKAMADFYGLSITGPGTYALTESIAPTGHIYHYEDVIIELGAYDIDLSGASFFAGEYQCFDQSSTGQVTGLKTAKLLWFGFSTSASAAVNSAAIQAAYDSGSPKVILPKGAPFSYDAFPDAKRSVTFKGPGIGDTWAAANAICRLHYTGSGVALPIGTTGNVVGVHFKGFMLSGTSSATGGILFGTYPYLPEESSIKDVIVRDFTKASASGIQYAYGVNCRLTNVVSTNNYRNFYVGGDTSSGTVLRTQGCRFEYATERGAYVDKVLGWTSMNDVFESNAEAGLYVLGGGGGGAGDYVSGISVYRGHFENNITVGGTDNAEMHVTGSGNAAKRVSAYDSHFASTGATYYASYDYADECILVNPNVSADNQIKVTANTTNFFPILPKAYAIEGYGSFTPGLAFGGATTGITYTTQTGTCSKDKDGWVKFRVRILLSSKGTANGAATITGLPYTCKTGEYAPVTIYFTGVSFADRPQGYVYPSGTIIYLEEVTNAGVATSLTDADFANDSLVDISGSYRATQ